MTKYIVLQFIHTIGSDVFHVDSCLLTVKSTKQEWILT